MKKVYSSQDSLVLGHVRNVLETAGIPCVVRNEHLRTGAGELPPIECWMELWIVREEDLETARTLVKEALEAPAPAQGAWRCPRCDERLEGQFTACWRCAGTGSAGKDEEAESA